MDSLLFTQGMRDFLHTFVIRSSKIVLFSRPLRNSLAPLMTAPKAVFALVANR